MSDRRYRLNAEELELVITGLVFIIDGAEDPRLSEAALALGRRLSQGRQGRPGGRWTREANRLWLLAERRSETRKW
ncbi:MAG: hypothetical protein ABIJ47_01715 [Candidatus Bathyarchaeota archaeon]